MNAQMMLEQANVAVAEPDEALNDAVANRSSNFPNSSARMPGQLPRSYAAWLSVTRNQLRAIGTLSSGWDSHGAGPLNPDSIERAWGLICQLSAWIPGLRKPHVNPTRSGGVQLEWTSGSRYFEIEFLNANTAHFFFEDHDAHADFDATVRVGQPLNSMIAYLRQAGT
ncbi:MAG TPA: hypothetical protein VIK18_23630 [Pirellulales bacterium]